MGESSRWRGWKSYEPRWGNCGGLESRACKGADVRDADRQQQCQLPLLRVRWRTKPQEIRAVHRLTPESGDFFVLIVGQQAHVVENPSAVVIDRLQGVRFVRPDLVCDHQHAGRLSGAAVTLGAWLAAIAAEGLRTIEPKTHK